MPALPIEIHHPESAEGKHLHVEFHPLPDPLGCVVLVHGLGEYSGRYDHVVAALNELNVAVVRYDLRGHGRSQGLRGHVTDYERHLDDLALVVDLARERFPGSPLVIYGHSMGAGIVANWCLKRLPEKNAEDVVGAVLSSPWLTLTKPPSFFRLLWLRTVSRFWPWFTLPAIFRVHDLCRDPHFMRRYRTDRLIHHRVTVGLAIQAYDAGAWALANAERFPVPVLAIHGGRDKLTSPESTKLFSRRAPAADLLFFEDLVHETHNEPEWRDVVRQVGTWIQDQLRAGRREKGLVR